MAAPNDDNLGEISIKWGGREYKLNNLSKNDSLLALKSAISQQTNVLPERQKLMGIKYKGLLCYVPTVVHEQGEGGIRDYTRILNF